jgi:hypothetical protein
MIIDYSHSCNRNFLNAKQELKKVYSLVLFSTGKIPPKNIVLCEITGLEHFCTIKK